MTDKSFDGLTRKMANGISRRSALGVLFATVFLGEGCDADPVEVDLCQCADEDFLCCSDHDTCCPPGFPHHCANSSDCYSDLERALNECNGPSVETCFA